MTALITDQSLLRAADPLIKLALQEDLGTGDVTTDSLIDPSQTGTARLVAKEYLITAGLRVAQRVFETLEPDLAWQTQVADGQSAAVETTLATVTGRVERLLKAERVALNFLQRLCGIATQTRRFVDLIEPRKPAVSLVDTRKTTPGWRLLEKYAVGVGGAQNHRFGLYDGVLIKDNHIAAAGSIAKAVAVCRSKVHHLLKIEIETADLEQVQQALTAGADVIMLDNMQPDQIREAVALINGQALVEISGGVNQQSLPELSRCGADLISVGALTHAARSMDISMRLENVT